MNGMTVMLLVANGLTLVWALRLLGRRPNRGLRQLVLTVGIVSVSQTVAFLSHIQGQTLGLAASALQECMTSMGTLAAVYLLWMEMRDQIRTDHMLRLVEYETRVRQAGNVRTRRQTLLSAASE
ncbi:MAG TPA: hypothetical protein VFQ91_17955 [Bryobacteraceae bacterium]|nr:hypothetical protein [Bryobacteraceae bacterium]